MTHPADPTARFAALVAGPETDLDLEQACLLVAAHFGPAHDRVATGAALDALATTVGRPTLGGVADAMTAAGYGGDATTYGGLAGSLLPEVVARRRGLPILLAVVATATGRRVGARLHVVGMPGHVLVGSVDTPEEWADVFNGVRLDRDGARELFRAILGPDAPWTDRHLAPTGPREIVARVLANIERRCAADGRHGDRASVLALRSLVPGVPAAERRELAEALARIGRFDRAADEIDVLLASQGGADADPELVVRAARWRARLN